MKEPTMHRAYFTMGRSQRFWLRSLTNVVMAFMVVVGLMKMFTQFRESTSFQVPL